MRFIWFALLVILPFCCLSQEKYRLETRDIDNFWIAFDQLKFAKSNTDSIEVIQKLYIEKASDYFKEFIKSRNFTSEEYVLLIRKHPKFWASIRPLTEKVKARKSEVTAVLEAYKKHIPNFKQPNVCFAIGCLRTGGTVSNNLILIGTEIAASNATTDKSELNPWLKSIIGSLGDIVAMVAHETIHTQKTSPTRYTLITAVLNEGVADFLANKITGLNINMALHKYGQQHDCELRTRFLADLKRDEKNYANWLYNGNKSTDRPADLGYYIGHKIAEEYYDKSPDKAQAISDLLSMKNYRKIFNNSHYINTRCN